jgi:dTDP-4-dehydrorhamnose reductase
MAEPVVIVSGANGQLGKELRHWTGTDTRHRYIFFGRDDMPIENFELVRQVFLAERPAFFINCAAFTAVDKAEEQKDLAFLVNAEAPGVLASICSEHATRFMHISTDYVFKGDKAEPYLEDDPTDPLNVYGASKLEGEKRVLANNPASVVIRTSWLYSAYGKNFVRTMLALMKDRSSVNVVDDQWGAPTHAADLAQDIIHILQSGAWHPGVYHYSNDGAINWYEFAVAIRELSGASCEVRPIPSSQYPTPARRPAYSVLNTGKFTDTWGIRMRPWKKSLSECLDRLELKK